MKTFPHKTEQIGGDFVVRNVPFLDLARTLDCGQCFRWSRIAPDTFRGTALGRVLTVRQRNRDLILENVGADEFFEKWANYFDLWRDYGEVYETARRHPVLNAAARGAFGIRVLNQDPWETLCTFIFSQNNNIPRIRSLTEGLCRLLGRPLADGFFDFPDPAAVASAGIAGLAPLRAGYRTAYLLDAAETVLRGGIDWEALREMPTDRAREALRRIRGVGPKVADCVLLFGLGHADALPADVWIKRALAAHFPEGFPAEAAPWAGILQQFVFVCMREGTL